MLNKCAFFYFSIVMLGLLFFSVTATAQTQPPAPPSPVEEPLAVTDVIINRSDKNAVAARDLAIVDAQRLAFQRFAENIMTIEAFKAFQWPDDKTIATFVQDFEIKNEQISTNLYVANFTVRFSQETIDYLLKAGGAGGDHFVQPFPLGSTFLPLPAGGAALPPEPVSILVLPYFKNISEKSILWEDPNPWREIWQALGNSTPYPWLTITVPLGDISDISVGSSEAVWKGDYGTIEKLRDNYKAGAVVLAVANKSDAYIQVDIYTYRHGKIVAKKSIPPYTGGEDYKTAFQSTLTQMIRDIQPVTPSTAVSAERDGLENEPSLKELAIGQQKPMELPSASEKITLEATMVFNDFAQWIEAQKRLSSVSPSLMLGISSLSKDAAWFTITVDSVNGIEGFKTVLAGKGLELDQLAVDQGVSGRPLYTLKMN